MRPIVPLLQDFRGDEGGSYTVEFVILVPLLLAALVFSFEFARALWAYDVMTRDVEAGARFLARSSTAPTAPCSVPSTAQDYIQKGTDAKTHFPWNGGTPVFTCNLVPFSNKDFSQDGSVIQLTAKVPVTLSLLSFLDTVTGVSLKTSYTLSVSDQTRFIGN